MAGKPNPRRSNGHRRSKLIRRLRARHDPCAICGLPIDYSLPPGDPMAFEVDEIIPVSRGGDPYDINNVQAAHRRCNQKRGNKMMDELLYPKPIVKRVDDHSLPLSRKW